MVHTRSKKPIGLPLVRKWTDEELDYLIDLLYLSYKYMGQDLSSLKVVDRSCGTLAGRLEGQFDTPITKDNVKYKIMWLKHRFGLFYTFINTPGIIYVKEINKVNIDYAVYTVSDEDEKAWNKSFMELGFSSYEKCHYMFLLMGVAAWPEESQGTEDNPIVLDEDLTSIPVVRDSEEESNGSNVTPP